MFSSNKWRFNRLRSPNKCLKIRLIIASFYNDFQSRQTKKIPLGIFRPKEGISQALVLPPVVASVLVLVVVAVALTELDEETTLVVVEPPVWASAELACEAQPARMRQASGKRMSLRDFFIKEPPRLLPFIPN
jgi:hypothetical protein